MKNDVRTSREQQQPGRYLAVGLAVALAVGFVVGSSMLVTHTRAVILGIGCVGAVCMMVDRLIRPPTQPAFWVASLTTVGSVLAFTRYPWLVAIVIAGMLLLSTTLPKREMSGWPVLLAIVFPFAVAVLSAAAAAIG